MASPFIPGLKLSRLFYLEAVLPILDAAFPGLPHSAALLGRGSEVLGFDDELSTDHDWGPRVMLFLQEEDHRRWDEAINAALRPRLPRRFRGYATGIPPSHPQGSSPPADAAGDRGPANHRVEVIPLRGFFLNFLAFDIRDEPGPADWLTFPEQKLRMITAGAVYHDDIGLQAVRNRFTYYPHDVWLYLLAAGWWRLHPEGNLVGRAGSVGDEVGSALIGARLVQDLMQLCFLMEREYAPYPKWFGTAFERLACAADLLPVLQEALQAGTWEARETALVVAYEYVAAMQNALRLAEPLQLETQRLWNRPFKVPWADFPGALHAQIKDPAVREIAQRWPVGQVDRFRDLLLSGRDRALLRRLFGDLCD